VNIFDRLRSFMRKEKPMTISPIFADIYELDLNGNPNIQAFVDAGLPWAGIGLKATEGTYYPRKPDWFQKHYPLVKNLAGARWGQTFFRWTYHYFRVNEDGAKQADFYMGLVESCGGFDIGDLRPVVDVESSEQPAHASPQQVIDGVSAFAARIKSRHGQAPILYGGSYIRDLGITDHMGCAYLITADYNSTLPPHIYTAMGWPLDKLLMWQYRGNLPSGPAGYPRTCPLGPGFVDLSAVTIANGSTPEQQLEWLRNDIQSA